MYKLTCLSMHHWYAFEAKDVPVNGTIGLIGRSGSGKSTIQDAVLTVLLGANASQLSLNAAAAGKGGKAGDRNLKGYCLCSFFDVDEGAPQREVAETTLVLTFTHTITKQTIACGLMMTADKDEHEVTVDRMFVVTGLEFRFSDFLQMDAKGQRILPSQADMYARIKAEHGTRLQAFSTKTSYVAGLLTTLNPAGPPDASRFMKALSACRHLKEIGKPSEFVRRFVLEDSRLKVDAVRSSIALWRELENDVEETRRKIERLREVVSRNALLVRGQLHHRADAFRIADIDRRLAESKATGLLEGIALREEQYEQAKSDLAQATSDNDAFADQIREAERVRAADGSTNVVEGLRRDRKRIAQGVTLTYGVVRSRLEPLGKVHGARFDIDEGERRNLAAGVASANLIRKAIATPDSLVAAVTDGSLRAAISKVKSASGSAGEVEMVRDSRTRMRDDLERRLIELRRRKEAAESGQAYVPKAVEEMLALLRAAGIHARVVSDLVKVNDPRWAMAASLMLAQEETAILPPIEHVEEALRIQKLHGDRLSECRILRTNRLRSESGTIKTGSLAEVLETHDPDVASFIAQRLGNIMRVESAAELMHHRMAITDDGLYASPLSVRKYRKVPSRIGRTDTRALMGELLAELNELSEHHAEADEHARSAEMLLQALRAIQAVDLDVLQREIDGYMEQLAELRGAEEQLTAASQGVDELSELIIGLEGRIKDARNRRGEADLRKERVSGEIQTMKERHKHARSEADRHRVGSIDHLKELQTPEAKSAAIHSDVVPDLWIPEDPLNWIDARIPYGTIHEDRTKILEGLRAEAESRQIQHKAGEKDQQRQAKHSWTQFVLAHPDEAKPEIADEPTAILAHAIALRERVTRNVLIPFEQQVRDARRRMDDSLKEDLLAKMGDKLKATNNQIRDLNKLLTEKSYVGGYRYTFARTPSEEHKDIIALVDAVQRNPGIGIVALLEDQSLSDGTGNLKRAMDQIEEMLRSGKDIDLIADHRRYFEYRIEALAPGATKARDFADLVGKLSGGEKEAPYYVAIAATMRSIYYPGLRAQSAPGVALVVLDEAFSKLDVENTRKLIDHFSEMGLQLVIAAPDNNLPMFMQCTDSVVYIHRGESSPRVSLEVMRPKEKLKEELRRRAPVYVESKRIPGPVVPPFGMLA